MFISKGNHYADLGEVGRVSKIFTTVKRIAFFQLAMEPPNDISVFAELSSNDSSDKPVQMHIFARAATFNIQKKKQKNKNNNNMHINSSSVYPD